MSSIDVLNYKSREEFPCYSYNFTNVVDYKQKLKKAIETKDRTEIVKISSTDFLAEYFSN